MYVMICEVCGAKAVPCVETWVPTMLCTMCGTLYYPPWFWNII